MGKTSAATKNKRRIKRSRGAKAQQKQILSNQNQIVSLKQHLNLVKQRIKWRCGFYDIVQAVGGVTVIPLTSGPGTAPGAGNVATVNNGVQTPVGWHTTMTPAPQVMPHLCSKACINTQWVDLAITSGGEEDRVSHTAFVVQLRADNAEDVYNDTALMTALTRDSDYVTADNSSGTDSGYGAYFNSDRFKIIKRIEFTTMGNPTYARDRGIPSTGNSGQGPRMGLVHRAQFKINYGNTVVKATGEDSPNSGAQIATLGYDDIEPRHKRFIVLINDNSSLDLQFPHINMSSLITGYQY